MAKNANSNYQKGVVSRYYEHRDTIMLQKLGELVTELYLADTGHSAELRRSPAKQDRLWQRVQQAMTNLKVPPAITKHIMEKRNVQILAKNLQDWQAGKIKK